MTEYRTFTEVKYDSNFSDEEETLQLDANPKAIIDDGRAKEYNEKDSDRDIIIDLDERKVYSVKNDNKRELGDLVKASTIDHRRPGMSYI